ncbi:MAG: LysM peptidoglycan-binding domain-containing protein [Lachnospiraceae bacterium]|nr:LysM peptidoglycan-binding domain-containing protein [Lachnospiraceae bacterium]
MEKETALPKNIRQIGDIQGKEKICIEDYVMTYIRKKEPQEESGYLGIFLGERKETEEAVYVFIRGILEIAFEIQEEEQERETKSRMKEALERERVEYFPGWDVLGCCIIGAYQTKQLEMLSEMVPESGQIIYHLQEQEETLFWKESEQYRRIKGYFVFYEQNRKMQEYLAEVFKDDSVEKESLPDRAIKSFREKVKEKSEKKTGSLLKLASSFFVVTVLVIGAIVVNRIDEIRNVGNSTFSEYEVLSNQIQQEGERLPATNYIAKEQESGAMTGEDPAGGNAGVLLQAANVENESSPQDTVDAENTDNLQSVANAGNMDNPQSVANAESTDSLQDVANMESTNGLQDIADAEIANGSQDSAAIEEAGMEHTGSTGADTPESEASEASSRAIRASYVIKEGDTLANICSKYYGSLDRVEEICDANNIADANMIMPGQKIVLP